MHMADALLSPLVGGAMWAASAGITVVCARRLKSDANERRTPLMGVLGAFVFSAQMINFAIPGTGSSGHLGGGLLLAILLGPHAAFLTITSILTVQALFFADGGLLALGCNVFNIGFLPCFFAYTVVYRSVAGARPNSARLAVACVGGGLVALQLGAIAVVLQTAASGITAIPVGKFLLTMCGIHAAIGLVEGLATFAIVSFVWKARPELVEMSPAPRDGGRSQRTLVVAVLLAALCVAGGLSWFASSDPDGLEWSLEAVTETAVNDEPDTAAHVAAQQLQEKLAVMPDYDFRNETDGSASAVDVGTSVAGLLGAAITLFVVGAVALALRRPRASN